MQSAGLLTFRRPTKEIQQAFARNRAALFGVGVFSAVVNVLSLTGAIFMLEVYDRVLPGRSIPTLLGLVAIAGILYLAQCILDVIRGRMLIRIGAALDARLAERVFQTIADVPLRLGNRADSQRALRDLDQIRTFLSAGGPIAFFDLPWMPFYLILCFVFHFWIGLTAVVGAIVLASVAWFTEIKARDPVRSAVNLDRERMLVSQGIARNAEAISAMGMRSTMQTKWGGLQADYVLQQQRTFDVTGGFGALSRMLRMVLQSGVLGVGAYLVINQQATAGIIIASSIITARALAPVELAISHWRGFIAFRDSLRRLEQAFAEIAPSADPLLLPAPVRELSLDSIGANPPGVNRLVVANVTFTLKAGQALAVVGPSASGKSSLARVIVGVWRAVRGKVRLDGATLDQWSSDELGKYIGYLPQNVDLFSGSVAQNIARFDQQLDTEKLYRAARSAGVHDLIVRLPEGYETQIGENGELLSAGQRQRIALARALYGDPFLVVLDEPNSHLDQEGEDAVLHAIQAVKEKGGIVIVIAHRPGVLAAVSHMLLLRDGRMTACGPRDEIIAKHFRAPVQVNSSAGQSSFRTGGNRQ